MLINTLTDNYSIVVVIILAVGAAGLISASPPEGTPCEWHFHVCNEKVHKTCRSDLQLFCVVQALINWCWCFSVVDFLVRMYLMRKCVYNMSSAVTFQLLCSSWGGKLVML